MSVIASDFAAIGDALPWAMHITHLNSQTVSIAVLLPGVATMQLHNNTHDCLCIQSQLLTHLTIHLIMHE